MEMRNLSDYGAVLRRTARRGAASTRPRPWQRELVRQLVIAGCGAAGYVLTNSIIMRMFSADAQQRLAIANARHVVHLETALHVFNEAGLYALVNGHAELKLLSNTVYMALHLPLIIAIAVWLFARQRPLYLLMRNAMLISGAIALACEFFPVAPPFMLPELSFVNTAAGHVYDVIEPKSFFDVYGAVPSIHVGWSVLMGLSLIWGTRSSWLHVFGAALPVLMTIAVVATGNHYYFDAFTGLLSAAVGLWLGALLLGRRNPLSPGPFPPELGERGSMRD